MVCDPLIVPALIISFSLKNNVCVDVPQAPVVTSTVIVTLSVTLGLLNIATPNVVFVPVAIIGPPIEYL